MFFREFPFDDALFVWDNIFAWYLCTGYSNIDLVDYIAVAMIVSLREYILQQIDCSGALQKLIKYARPIEANKVIKHAYKNEQIYLETPMNLTAADERPRSEPLKNPMLAGLVKEPKVTAIQSRYAPENIAKAKTEEKDAFPEVSFSKPLENEMRDLKKKIEGDKKKSEPSTQSQSVTTERKPALTQPVISTKDLERNQQTSADTAGQPQESASHQQDRKQPKPRVLDEEEDLIDESPQDAQIAAKVPLKTAGSADEDPFDGLIKAKPKPAALPKEILVPRDFLSKINAKLYECISELQLDNMRANSTKVSSTITTLESLREQIFASLSTSKSSQQPLN